MLSQFFFAHTYSFGAVIGLMFTFVVKSAYQAIGPTSTSRTPSNQICMHEFLGYNAPYDAPTYAPPAPHHSAQMANRRSISNTSYGHDKDKDGKEDPFGDHGVTPPMPTHWAEECDVTS